MYRHLILTLDYELFGDGSGDIFTHIIKPTELIIKVCETYDIKTTIFFEILEYIKLKEEWLNGNTMGYTQNPIEAIERQIQQIAINGHDIQLHIHPQWHNAIYKNGKWQLNMNYWRLADFHDGNYGIKELIAYCKIELESLIKPVLPNYECIGLRAGGYNIMPSKEVYSTMQELGMKYDSSIYPGGYETGDLSIYDYRNVSYFLDHWWADANDIREISNTEKNILEIPIFALPVIRWKRLLTMSKIKSLVFKKQNSISPQTEKKISQKSLFEKLIFLFQPEISTWDICSFPSFLHKSFFEYIEKNIMSRRNNFVLIGHPKNLLDPKLFEDFVKLTKKRKVDYNFLTLSEYYESII